MMRASKVATDHLLRSKPNPSFVSRVRGIMRDAYGVAAHLLLSGIPTTVVALAEPKGLHKGARFLSRPWG